jgi:hypothetical protein
MGDAAGPGEVESGKFRKLWWPLLHCSAGGGGRVADFPVSTSQDIQPANQNGEAWVTFDLPSRFTCPQELARNMVNTVLTKYYELIWRSSRQKTLTLVSGLWCTVANSHPLQSHAAKSDVPACTKLKQSLLLPSWNPPPWWHFMKRTPTYAIQSSTGKRHRHIRTILGPTHLVPSIASAVEASQIYDGLKGIVSRDWERTKMIRLERS